MTEQPNPTTKIDNELTQILDSAFDSDHTNGSHADDPSDKRPCYCHNKLHARQALTTLILNTNNEARIDEVSKLPPILAPYAGTRLSELRALKDKSKEIA